TIIAHDLGNPLNSLLLSSTHLEKRFDRLDRDDVKEFVHSIYTQTTGMSSLLQNLMEWAVSQLGKMECKPGEVNLKQLTAETIRQMKYTAEKKDIDISATVRENTYAWADKHMMKAVLRNLVSNALKFTYPGGKIDICAQDSGNGIEVAVSDNGVGMEQTRIEGLFKSEFHQSTRGTGDEKGTGLGLSLCKEFVEKNGGEIRVESQPGKGSCFSFTLPNPDAKQKQNK
ncbi:MAG: HAMP domain-containing histidine kinase, partial [bacterium]|nr:HAMP domain-containing histidine kinase [bacterium]